MTPPDSVVARANQLRVKWGLLDAPCLRRAPGAQRSWVADVHTADGPAFLKLSVHDASYPEMQQEADALEFWDGNGAVKLLRADDEALLMEKCIEELWSSYPSHVHAEALTAAASVLRRLHARVPAEGRFRSLEARAREWCRCPLVRDPTLARAAGDLLDELLATKTGPDALLHGDFHPSNVMRSVSTEWVAIDPIPLAGDPAAAPARWVLLSAQYKGGTRAALNAFESAGLNAKRVAGWAFIQAIGTEANEPLAKHLASLALPG